MQGIFHENKYHEKIERAIPRKRGTGKKKTIEKMATLLNNHGAHSI